VGVKRGAGRSEAAELPRLSSDDHQWNGIYSRILVEG
jgi:hypothetical protein